MALRLLSFSRLPQVSRLGYVLGVVFLGSCCAGCGRKGPQPEPARENLSKLVWAYQEYGRRNGRPPKDEAMLKEFINSKKPMGMISAEEDVDQLFISPRDQQPYKVLYGEVLYGRRPGLVSKSGKPAPPPVFAYEQTGFNGKRYVALMYLSSTPIGEVEEATFQGWITAIKAIK